MSASTSAVAKLDTKPIMKMDPWLEPYLPGIEKRWELFAKWKGTIDSAEGGYEKFSRGYERFGLQAYDDGTITYREWAPNAVKANLVGDFSKWIVRVSRDFYRLTQNFLLSKTTGIARLIRWNETSMGSGVSPSHQKHRVFPPFPTILRSRQV